MQNQKDKLHESVGNYTKFKLTEMLIDKHKDTFKSLNHIEDICDDVMNILSLCGMKYYNELRNNFDTDNR
jgi:hypothetical protein